MPARPTVHEDLLITALVALFMRFARFRTKSSVWYTVPRVPLGDAVAICSELTDPGNTKTTSTGTIIHEGKLDLSRFNNFVGGSRRRVARR